MPELQAKTSQGTLMVYALSTWISILTSTQCDESRPSCNNCDRFMVTCNYDRKQADLDSPLTRKSQVVLPILDPVSLNDALLGMINSTLAMQYPKGCGEPLQLQLPDLDKLKRWQNRTVLTVGTPAVAQVYQKEIIKLVARFPFLMHCVLALTTKHDRYLTPDSHEDPYRSALEYFHYGRAAALFNQKLSAKDHVYPEPEHDALWATAVFLGNIAASTLDGDTIESSWPMKDGTSGEALTWLRVHEGLGVLWRIAAPYAPGHMFHELVNTPEHSYMMTKLNPEVKPGCEGIPEDFAELCGIDEHSTKENNPYQKALRVLLPLLNLEWTRSNGLKFMSFTAGIDPRYKTLLKEKDAAALVLLAWWYALILQSPWHLAQRASLECRSICIYLGRKCPENTLVQRLLRFPRQKAGILREVEEDPRATPWTSTRSRYGAIMMMPVR